MGKSLFQMLYNQDGSLHCVTIKPELWSKIEPLIKPYLTEGAEGALEVEPSPAPRKPEPIEEWEEFLKFWDFQYPQSAEVVCKNCGAHIEDWTNDPEKHFWLKSAQLGGLVVFDCTTCGATVRKKHFKDHVCFEVTQKQ